MRQFESHQSSENTLVDKVSDETLFDQVAKGDRKSLGNLIERHQSRLYGLLVRLGRGDRDQADDLFQETFVRAVRAAGTFDGSKKFKPWITAIAVNLFRDEARKRKSRSEVSLSGDVEESDRTQPIDLDETPAQQAERSDEAERVNRSLLHLTAKERIVVLLHFYDRMTLVEVAETLEIPVGTVKSRLHSALTRLRDVLEG